MFWGLLFELSTIPPVEAIHMNIADATHAARTCYFADERSPHEIRSLLEREHLTRLEPSFRADGRLEYVGRFRCNGLPCSVRLTYLAAHPSSDHYSLHIEMSWAHLPVDYREYYGRTSGSWFDLWCSSFKCDAPLPEEPVTDLYRQRAAQALEAEAHLTTIPALQQEILSALKKGSTFSTSHKEGGTRIGFANGRFFREDYGESPSHQRFSDEAKFLAALHRFYEWQVSRNVAPEKLPEELTWLLIFRHLNAA